MSIKSMTGYGSATGSGNGYKIEVQITSVNKKQSDVSFSLPSTMSQYESRIDGILRKFLSRGTLSVDIKVLGAPGCIKGKIDEAAFARNSKILRDLAKANKLSDDVRVSDVMSMPDVICRYENGHGFEPKLWAVISKALAKAVKQLVGMRTVEGRELQKHVCEQFVILRGLLARILERSPVITASYRDKLIKRIGDAGVKVDTQDPSLARELAFFADRSDISEETVRLESHFKQADKIMKSGEPAGRMLDFLCQEMFREINTIGSKANDSVISEIVVNFKAQLEKVREQVQNVE